MFGKIGIMKLFRSRKTPVVLPLEESMEPARAKFDLFKVGLRLNNVFTEKIRVACENGATVTFVRSEDGAHVLYKDLVITGPTKIVYGLITVMSELNKDKP